MITASSATTPNRVRLSSSSWGLPKDRSFPWQAAESPRQWWAAANSCSWENHLSCSCRSLHALTYQHRTFHVSLSVSQRRLQETPHLAPGCVVPAQILSGELTELHWAGFHSYRARLVNSCLWSQLQASQRWFQPLLASRCYRVCEPRYIPRWQEGKVFTSMCVSGTEERRMESPVIQPKAWHNRQYDQLLLWNSLRNHR